MTILHKIIQFITTDMWQIETKNASWSKSFFLRQLRVMVLAFRGFKEDKLQLRASALTLYSLLAIVPVLAMIFAILGLLNLAHGELIAVTAYSMKKTGP